MSERKGQISVQTADIFPIIKKWLYSEHDIFIRELVANATDAITKRATLARTRNEEIPAGEILVTMNKSEKTITIKDNGLGMTEEEVEKYIAQLAFSGAEEWVKKLKASGADEKQDIIGKFGLGFYSSFMVAEKVEVETLSMNAGAKATKWTCAGDTEYTFSDSDKKEVGTTITLHVNEDGQEFLDEWKLSSTLRRHCDFMPYAIKVLDEERKPTYPLDKEGKEDKTQPAIPVTPTLINDTTPLWKRDPKELKDEDYKTFFRKLFPAEPEPLFWIHLKVDHPFTLEGILYFPKFNPTKPQLENNIRLFCKQVFVSDNVKNVIPEFLGLLKGVIDSSDIPLNVSRSSLQGDPNIRRISNYVIKKVAEALKKLYKSDREKYEAIWPDIGMFVKYGCVSDEKFDELMRDKVLLKTSEGKFLSLTEYTEAVPKDFQDKLKGKVVYFEKDKADTGLLSHLREASIPAVEMDEFIDPHFMQHAEFRGENKIQFVSIGSEIENILGSENTSADDIKVKEFFEKVLLGDNKDETRDIELGKLKGATVPAYIKVDENMKRFSKMAQAMGNAQSFPIKRTLVVNAQNPLVKNALKIHESGKNEDLAKDLCYYVQDLAQLSSEGLEQSEREAFVKRSQSLMEKLTNLAL